MAAVFFLTFTIGDWLKGYIELFMENVSGWVAVLFAQMQVNSTITSLVTDGIIAGVGGMLTFLPNIFILFLALEMCIRDRRIVDLFPFSFFLKMDCAWVYGCCE